MRSISVRNVPDDVYEGMRNMAKANHRSLQEQIKLVLEQEVKLTRKSPLAQAAKWRKRLAGRQRTDAVELVRSDRSR